MNVVNAVIFKESSEDGVFLILPESPFQVGDSVEVDLDSKRMVKWINQETHAIRTAEMVDLVKPRPDNKKIFLPTELLIL